MYQTPYTPYTPCFPRYNPLANVTVGEFRTLASVGGPLFAAGFVIATDTLLRAKLHQQYGVLY